MADTFTIRYRLFRADIYTEALEQIPLRKLRKLFSLAAKDRRTNLAAIDTIKGYLDQHIPEAQATMRASAKAYEDGWKKVPNPRSRKPAVVEQLRRNKELTDNFNRDHARYEKLVAVRKVYMSIFAADTKH